MKLKEASDSKSRMISELQTLVATTKADLVVAGDSTAMALGTPSIAHLRELARTTGRVVAPSYAETAKQLKAGTDHGKLYSEALRGKVKHTTNLQLLPKKTNPLTQSKKY